MAKNIILGGINEKDVWVVRPPTVPRYLGQGHQKGGEERIIEDISKNIIQDSDEIYLDENC